MPRGPLPKPAATRRRTNEPTIPTTDLPLAGRSGPTPKVPKWVTLGDAGTAWWRWAWHTPQAAAWAAGHEAFIARRAALEDDLATLDAVDGLDLAEILQVEWSEAVGMIEATMRRLHGMAAGRLAVSREMREMDDRLGLSPKAMAALRWQIVADKADEHAPEGVTAISAYRDALG